MAENNNATCSICGNGYHVCRSCSDAMKLQPWKIHCCSAPHFQVFQVVRGFSTGVYNKDEFKSKLKKVDLSDLDSYREHIKALIKDALKEDEVAAEHIVEVEVAEKATVEKPVYSRKRNYKVDNVIKEDE